MDFSHEKDGFYPGISIMTSHCVNRWDQRSERLRFDPHNFCEQIWPSGEAAGRFNLAVH